MSIQNKIFIEKKINIINSEVLKNVKLVALDLDGTLLDDNFKISQRTIDCIKNLINRNINVVLVTGRVLKSVYMIRNMIGADLPIVAYNGGKIVISNKEIYTKKIPIVEGKKIIKYGEEKGLYVKVYIDDILFVEKDEEISKLFCQTRGIEYKAVGKLSENINEDINIITIYYKNHIYGNVDDILKDIDVTITASATNALDFIPKGVSKGKALKFVADYLNVKREEILAIGNSKNDIDMLNFAGIGIAMKNSDSMLLEKWNYITEYTNNEEGVYHVLKYI